MLCEAQFTLEQWLFPRQYVDGLMGGRGNNLKLGFITKVFL